MTKPWTAAEVTRLKEQIAKGKQPRHILDLFPGRSRNAILGQIYRIRNPGVHNQRPKRVARRKKRKERTFERKFRRVKQAPHAHPLVRQLIDLQNKHEVSSIQLAVGIGISYAGVHAWRQRNNPELQSIIAAFNYLGYELVVVKKEKEDD